jgi:hypothetical protein
MTWLFKFAITVTIGIFALKTIGGSGMQSIVTTTDAMNLLSIAKYVENRFPDVVIVGSSLSARLSEGYFNSPTIENLSLAGSSSNTGLEIVAAAPKAPKLVLVEANILARSLDKDLIDRSTNRAQVFRPLRWAAGAYERYLHPPKTKAQGLQEAERLLAAPPSDAISANTFSVVEAVRQTPLETSSDRIKLNLVEIRRLKSILEARGARVLLFHVPCSTAIEEAPISSTTARLAHAEFSDAGSWLHFEVDRSQLRWRDGLHLDERSAILVARAIEAALPGAN